MIMLILKRKKKHRGRSPPPIEVRIAHTPLSQSKVSGLYTLSGGSLPVGGRSLVMGGWSIVMNGRSLLVGGWSLVMGKRGVGFEWGLELSWRGNL